MISALISEAQSFHFRIEAIDADLGSMQKIIGGYLETVVARDRSWHLYCDEEGKLKGKPVNRFATQLVDKTARKHGYRFSPDDHLVGTILWLGPVLGTLDDDDEFTVPLDIITQYADIVMAATDSDRPIVIVRHNWSMWVFDTPTAGPTQRIAACVERARLTGAAGEKHGIVEVYANVSPGQWQEIRVEIMDDIRIDLHDERQNRSYG